VESHFGGFVVDFNDAALERYGRQILLKEFGVEGQQRLSQSSVVVLGVGGLGCPAAAYLGAAGIGRLGLVDADSVDLSNLQRQILHYTPDLGAPKVESAAEKLRALNPLVRVEPIKAFIQADNIAGLIKDYDFVVDATDNFAAKFLINDACVMAGKPFVHGGILGFEGQAMTVLPGRSACYRCVFPHMPPPGTIPNCRQAGVLGAVAGLLGTVQAAEAIKFVSQSAGLLTDVFLTFDARTFKFRRIPVKRSLNCPVCGEQPTIITLRDELPPCC
jgi:molybdopterin/thiamine biosynthesis adenylyltransferase